MLKKLLSGEFSLGETFWKFGILGVSFFRAMSYVFGILLDKRIMNRRIIDYYLYHFKPVNPDIMAILWTLCYLFMTGFFLYYCIAVWLGIWRTSANFERSALLKQLIRLIMLAFLSVNVISVF